MLLSGLAHEIQLLIFQLQHSIDDVHHLARSCKGFNAVFEGSRYTILRSVILRSPIHNHDIRISLFIHAMQEFTVKHSHRLDAETFSAHHLDCQPTMDALADILNVSRDRHVLSVQMVDDILARWGGLRPLIDICFAFDGRWPTNAFGKNPLTANVGGERSCLGSQPFAVGPSPQWVERFYKAISSIWLHQEVVSFSNIINWERPSALAMFRFLGVFIAPQATIRDYADIIEVGNILFVRLFNPPFQLGSPSIFHRRLLTLRPEFHDALRPPDIGDLLILSTRPQTTFPRDLLKYLSCRGAHLPSLLPEIRVSHHEDDFLDQYEERLSTDVMGTVLGMTWQFVNLFRCAGVATRSALPQDSGNIAMFFGNAILDHFGTWERDSDYRNDCFAESSTSDQVVERILGKPLLRELLRCDLDYRVAFAQVSLRNWYEPAAA